MPAGLVLRLRVRPANSTQDDNAGVVRHRVRLKANAAHHDTAFHHGAAFHYDTAFHYDKN
jgi:hypothetical protein